MTVHKYMPNMPMIFMIKFSYHDTRDFKSCIIILKDVTRHTSICTSINFSD